MRIISPIILALLASAALSTAAAAAPVTYTQTVDQVDGNIGGGLFPFTNETIILTATADTTALVVATVQGSAGRCVPAASATIKIGAAAATAITTPVQVCATLGGQHAGFYTDAGSTFLLASPSAYVIDLDLDSNAVYGANDVNAGAASVSSPLPTVFTDADNTAGPSSFVVDVSAAPPAPIPTLSEWAMIMFGLILAGGAALYIQRRQLIA